jgi:hypothetical protein
LLVRGKVYNSIKIVYIEVDSSSAQSEKKLFSWKEEVPEKPKAA